MSTRSLKSLARAWVLATLLGSVHAVTSSFGGDLNQPAGELVQEALYREVYSMQGERDRLLEQAARQQPDSPEVRWHQGHVRLRGQWVPVDAVPDLARDSVKLDEYEQLREETPDTIEGHLALANWCVDRRLIHQQRAHLERVLEEVPDHAAARSLLGYRFVDGRWYSQAEWQALLELRETERLAAARWRRDIESIGKLLRDANAGSHSRAAEKLAAIDELEVIPVLEDRLSGKSARAGMLVVDWLAGRSAQVAVSALARQAVLSPWPEVREMAAVELGRRDPDRFVPEMLDAMETPVSARVAFARSRRGSLLFQTSFQRETADEQQELLLQREYVRRSRAGGSGRLTLMRAVFNAWNLGNDWGAAVQRQNARTEVINQRIAAALNVATGQQLPAEPRRWWEWWNDRQDVVLQGGKQTRRLQRGDQVTVVDLVPQQSTGGARTSTRPARVECLAAGSVIWTMRGGTPVESIQVGDLVLSQDVESGELGYKPVVRTTVRQPEPLLRIELENETISATRGHRFWVSGKSWLRSANLGTALPLHTVSGVTTVLSVEPISEAPTFNLVVADFHTYFVGESRVLSHDVTTPKAVDNLVPGMRH